MLRRVLTRRSIIAFTLSAVLLALPFAHVTRADNDNVVTSVAKLPFAGSFYDSVTGESVRISSDVHVLTELTFNPTATTLDLHAFLLVVDASGVTTGCRYVTYGANYLLAVLSPRPRRNAVAQVQFVIYPPIPIPPGDPCRSISHLHDSLILKLNLRFATDGTLLVGGEGGSTVFVCGDRIGSCRD